MFEQFRDRGLRILGFPCNQFANEEPGSESEIRQFCTNRYGVQFDMFGKIDVKGDQQAPLYEWLTSDENPWGPHRVRWNFQKYLIDRRGRIAATFDPIVEPEHTLLRGRLQERLARPSPA